METSRKKVRHSTRNLAAAYDRIIRKSDWIGGCLVCGYSTGSHGYAQAWDGVTVVLAHRIVWEWNHGPIPEGVTVDHEVCRNRRCVNIEHLRLLPNLDNARRNLQGRDWPIGEGECIRGHHQSWWRPKGPERSKGYCHGCRMVRQAEKRGTVLRLDYDRPSIAD